MTLFPLFPELIDEREAAKLLHVSHRTLQEWRSKRGQAGPPFVKSEGRCLYQVDVLREWILGNIIRSGKTGRAIVRRSKEATPAPVVDFKLCASGERGEDF